VDARVRTPHCLLVSSAPPPIHSIPLNLHFIAADGGNSRRRHLSFHSIPSSVHPGGRHILFIHFLTFLSHLLLSWLTSSCRVRR
ncbi:hypothetical protein PFISCL1PPCAC_25292, partial [Pristionchus fissidentatus]